MPRRPRAAAGPPPGATSTAPPSRSTARRRPERRRRRRRRGGARPAAPTASPSRSATRDARALRPRAARARAETARRAARSPCSSRPRAGRGAGRPRPAVERRRAGRRSSSPACGRPSRRRSRAGRSASTRGGERLRARVRGARRARPRGGDRRAARRHGRLRAALPRARHRARRGRERRVDCARPARPRVGRPGLGRIELARTVGAWTDDGDRAALAAVRPGGARHHADEAVWAALWEPEGACGVEDGAPVHHLRRRRPPAPRRARAVAGATTGLPAGAPRGGEVLCGSSLDLGALRLDCAFFRWHLEGRAGVGRYDILRRAARVIRAVVSDFGGVLTTPLLDGVRARPGADPASRPRRSARRCRTPARAEPAVRARARRDHRGEFLATLERELTADSSAATSPCTASADRYGRAGPQRRAVRPTTAALHERGLRLAMLTNNVREWEPTGGPSCRSTRSSRSSSTPRSSACASPTRRSTRSCSSGSGCRAEACAFVDDLERNVDAAPPPPPPWRPRPSDGRCRRATAVHLPRAEQASPSRSSVVGAQPVPE